jgi:hypothetical protein
VILALCGVRIRRCVDGRVSRCDNSPIPQADIDAEEMFAEIRSAKLLGEYRDMSKGKFDELMRILQTIGNIAFLHPEIAEIDLNPIMIRGNEPIVAYALMVIEALDC